MRLDAGLGPGLGRALELSQFQTWCLGKTRPGTKAERGRGLMKQQFKRQGIQTPALWSRHVDSPGRQTMKLGMKDGWKVCSMACEDNLAKTERLADEADVYPPIPLWIFAFKLGQILAFSQRICQLNINILYSAT